MGDLQFSKEELLLKEYILKGNEFYYKKKYEKSIECFDKALEIDSKDADAWNNKGLAPDNLGKYNQAIECYDKALEIDPKNATAWNSKGLALDNLGNGIGNFQYVAQGTATVGNQTTIK